MASKKNKNHKIRIKKAGKNTHKPKKHHKSKSLIHSTTKRRYNRSKR